MIIRKIAKVVFIFSVFITVGSVNVNARENGSADFDWNPVMDAITMVESGGNSHAVNGPNCGAMQITPALVKDVNAILKQRGDNRRYTLNDRFNIKKSREMFVIIMSKYNPTNNVEKAIRIWNGGCGYTTRGTQRYYQKVMKHMK